MGLGQYDSRGEYYGMSTASSVFLILTVTCDILPFLEFNMGLHSLVWGSIGGGGGSVSVSRPYWGP